MTGPVTGTEAIQIWAPAGIGEIGPDGGMERLAAEICAAAMNYELGIEPGDILVVASKVVAKAEGRLVAESDRAALVDQESLRVVASRRTATGVTKVVQSRSGPVLAAAGIDSSNVPDGMNLLLPEDPMVSAEELLRAIQEGTGVAPLGIVISDTSGRPWRHGVSDFALGVAGMTYLEDLRGTTDDTGHVMDVTIRAVADELASAADLAKGKTGGRPVAIVRGLRSKVQGLPANGTDYPAGETATGLTRTGESDWFRYGTIEAVRAALGVIDNELEPPHIDPSADSIRQKSMRALSIAISKSTIPITHWRVEVSEDGTFLIQRSPTNRPQNPVTANTPSDPNSSDVALGYLVARLEVAAWSEGLNASIKIEDCQFRNGIHSLISGHDNEG